MTDQEQQPDRFAVCAKCPRAYQEHGQPFTNVIDHEFVQLKIGDPAPAWMTAEQRAQHERISAEREAGHFVICGEKPAGSPDGPGCGLRSGHVTAAGTPHRNGLGLEWTDPTNPTYEERYDESVTIGGANPRSRRITIDPPAEPVGHTLALLANEHGAEKVLTRAHEVLASDPALIAELRHEVETLEERARILGADRDGLEEKLGEAMTTAATADRLRNLLDLALHHLRSAGAGGEAGNIEHAMRDTGDLPAPEGYVRQSVHDRLQTIAAERQEDAEAATLMVRRWRTVGRHILGIPATAPVTDREDPERVLRHWNIHHDQAERMRAALEHQNARIEKWRQAARDALGTDRYVSRKALVKAVRKLREPTCGARHPDYDVPCTEPVDHVGDHLHEAGDVGVTWERVAPVTADDFRAMVDHLDREMEATLGFRVRADDDRADEVLDTIACGAWCVVAGVRAECTEPDGHDGPHVAAERPEVVWR